MDKVFKEIRVAYSVFLIVVLMLSILKLIGAYHSNIKWLVQGTGPGVCWNNWGILTFPSEARMRLMLVPLQPVTQTLADVTERSFSVAAEIKLFFF